jgi:hypothetical protein
MLLAINSQRGVHFQKKATPDSIRVVGRLLLTVGPGSISVAITLGTNAPQRLLPRATNLSLQHRFASTQAVNGHVRLPLERGHRLA